MDFFHVFFRLDGPGWRSSSSVNSSSCCVCWNVGNDADSMRASSSSSLQTSSSSSSKMSTLATLLHVCLLQCMQITEQLIPAFLHPQAASQFPLHLQEMSFNSSGGAGSAVLVIGSSPRLVCRQPHPCGSLKNPSQVWTWRYVRKMCWRTALLVGGSSERWFTLFAVIDFAKRWNRKIFIDFSCLSPPYRAIRNCSPAQVRTSGSTFSCLNNSTDDRSSGFFSRVLMNFDLLYAGTPL